MCVCVSGDVEAAGRRQAGGVPHAASSAPAAPARPPPTCAPTGRSWLACPKEASRRDADSCFLPKRTIHTWAGHSKGVNAIRWAGRGSGGGGDLRGCGGQPGGVARQRSPLHGGPRATRAAAALIPCPCPRPRAAASSRRRATCCCRRGWMGRSRFGTWPPTKSACAPTWGTARCALLCLAGWRGGCVVGGCVAGCGARQGRLPTPLPAASRQPLRPASPNAFPRASHPALNPTPLHPHPHLQPSTGRQGHLVLKRRPPLCQHRVRAGRAGGRHTTPCAGGGRAHGPGRGCGRAHGKGGRAGGFAGRGPVCPPLATWVCPPGPAPCPRRYDKKICYWDTETGAVLK